LAALPAAAAAAGLWRRRRRRLHRRLGSPSAGCDRLEFWCVYILCLLCPALRRSFLPAVFRVCRYFPLKSTCSAEFSTKSCIGCSKGERRRAAAAFLEPERPQITHGPARAIRANRRQTWAAKNHPGSHTALVHTDGCSGGDCRQATSNLHTVPDPDTYICIQRIPLIDGSARYSTVGLRDRWEPLVPAATPSRSIETASRWEGGRGVYHKAGFAAFPARNECLEGMRCSGVGWLARKRQRTATILRWGAAGPRAVGFGGLGKPRVAAGARVGGTSVGGTSVAM
jgi:hypothetical protein